jgi:predicted lipoprotein with Yx(FWY)xxD motif
MKLTNARSTFRKPLWWVAFLMPFILILAACAPAATAVPPTDTVAPAPTTAPAPTDTVAPTATTAAVVPVTGEASINVATDAKLGKILVGNNGMTLYMFGKDTPNTSNCTAGCLKAWPPLVTTSGTPSLGAGVDASLVGTAALADGSKIVTYNKMPLYYYAKDTKAGDTNGQGVGSVWFVVGPDGKPVGMDTTPAAATAAPTSAAAATEPSITLVNDPKLGNILVGDKGMTLYIYTKDTPNTTTCVGGCLKAWPALITQGKPTLGPGVDPTLIGTAAMADGSKIVTYNKMPLYYFAKDTKAGDTNGQGVGSVWFVVGADGKPVGMTAPAATVAPTAASSGGGTGY